MPDEQQQWNRLIKEVALRAGVSPADVLEWPSERLQPYLNEMIAQQNQGIRDTARRRIIMDRVARLMEASGMPLKGMTIGEAVEQGYLSADDLDATENVTEEEITAEIQRSYEH